MDLQNLSPEVLNLILGNESTSWMVLRLWKCGSTLLNAKLASAITYIDLRHSRLQEAQYPRFLSCFRHLRHLSLSSRLNLVSSTYPDLQREIEKLPKTLVSLTIESDNPKAPFLNYAPDWTSKDPRFISTEYQLGSSELINLNVLFPQLHTMGVLTSGGQHCALSPADFPALPSTLTTLAVHPTLNVALNAKCFSVLPRSLTHLLANVEIVFSNDDSRRALVLADIADAPPNLELISEFQWYGNVPKDVSWMPMSLTRVSRLDSWNLKTIRHGPPKLNNVTLDDIPSDSLQPWTLELPKHLTSFMWLPESENAPKLTVEALTQLPRTLTLLQVRYFDMIAWNEIRALGDDIGLQEARKAIWPPLKEFVVCRSLFSSDQLDLLPSTLGKLSLHVISLINVNTDLELNCSFLPNSLGRLELSSSYPISITLSGSMPPDLRTLTSELAFKEFGDAATTCNLTRIDLETALQRPLMEPNFHLPPKLVALSIAEWHALWFDAIPRTVTRLRIKRLFIPFSYEYNVGDFFGELPPGLTSLSIVNASTDGSTGPKTFSSLCFSSLPSLAELYVSTSVGDFTSAVLKNLPRNMRTLGITLNSMESDDAIFLPPKLRSLHLGPHINLQKDYFARYWPIRAIAQLQKAIGTVHSDILRSRLSTALH